MSTAKPTAAYQLFMRVRLRNAPGVLGRLASAIGSAGGNIAEFESFQARGSTLERGFAVNCRSEEHQQAVVAAAAEVADVEVLDWHDRTFAMHEGGKIETVALCPVADADDLSMAYTPGVARVCRAIAADPELANRYTIKKNTVAIVTDGTAVLGLGDIGPLAALPVMEGKALLFKEFAGIDAFPICLDTRDPDEIVRAVQLIAPAFGGVNLEDIAAPACFEIEEQLRALVPIPVFHDDQHGTAIVVLAALENSLTVVGKAIADITVVLSGTGAAGVAITKMLLAAGVGMVIGADSQGAIYAGRPGLNASKQWFAHNTNPARRTGSLRDVLRGADVFVGVSGPGVIDAADLRTMAAQPIVFALANPEPEIRPEAADGLAAVMATGRSDYPNQINNVLAFPGVFRGALDAGATDITESMKRAAATAIAAAVDPAQLSPGFVIPSVFDTSVARQVAAAVAAAAVADGVVR
jgi:malate dehydrogenase (oxaloacetate-decarboxylating)